AEPILARIQEDRRVVVSTVFDNTHYDTLEVHRYPSQAQTFTWQLWCTYMVPPLKWFSDKDVTAPIKSPIVMGCMAASKSYLEEIGFLDEGMQVYGGENVELGLRVWQCGGSVEVLPCSRLAHIERHFKPYAPDLSSHMRRNALRVAEIWMDDFKRNVYMAWNVPMNGSGIDIGDISERMALRKRLNCKSFAWYLENVLPSLPRHDDIVQYGVMTNNKQVGMCMDKGNPISQRPILYQCHGYTPQNTLEASSRLLHFEVTDLTVTTTDDDYLVADRRTALRIVRKIQRLFTVWLQNGELRFQKGEKCLEVKEPAKKSYSLELVLVPCSGQKWDLAYFRKS
uniref:UDP-N-acetyl-alpha-D-galactosamine:polypeptide N-acetylgalactosaminyltransferase 18a n=1 Tax=Petromyzon marinus TaxID=7757 RepID=S4RJ89_PETMA